MAEKRRIPLIVSDGGVLDSAAYLEGGAAALASEFPLSISEIYKRYDLIIRLVSLATSRPDLFGEGNNAQRFEGLQEAIERKLATRKGWEGHSKRVFISGSLGLEATTE